MIADIGTTARPAPALKNASATISLPIQPNALGKRNLSASTQLLASLVQLVQTYKNGRRKAVLTINRLTILPSSLATVSMARTVKYVLETNKAEEKVGSGSMINSQLQDLDDVI